MSDTGWVVSMDAATRDTRFADAMERVVSDAVDEAVKTTEAGAGPISVRERRRRADAFRRMAGVRV